MRKLFILAIVASCTLIFSCKKNNSCGYPDSDKTAPETERDNLADSLAKYGINANAAPSGFYYKIIKPGSGNFVSNLCSSVSSTYWGGFFNGTGFDSSLSKPATFALGQTIVGWQKAIPLVKEGGEIDIYLPPSLGYGTDTKTDGKGNVVIPPNSYLVFKVTVTKIQ